MNKAISAGELRPVIDRVFSFEEAPAAFRHYVDGGGFGKIVISHSAWRSQNARSVGLPPP